MDRDHSERQLLLALLAFQNNFIDRPKLLLAFDAWSQDRSRSIASLLVEQGAINNDERQLLEGLAARHVARFDNDVQKSLGHVSAVYSSVRDELQKIASPDLQASLRAVGKDADPYATVAHKVGESTSDGTRFRILRPHARGGLGEVFVAEDGELPREVALKQIQARHADDADSRARFVQEAEITGALEHPNIVPVYGLGTYADGRPFYAMRFIRGDSLQDAVKRFHNTSNPNSSDRTLQFRKLLQRFIDVCNAIDYAHSRGVLHRDLKPGNIMLGKYGETLVVDWGLAKAVGHQDDGKGGEKPASEERTLRPSGGNGSAETAYGAAIGTPAYMSPEQAAGRLDDFGPASDVYSLGATLYELLTGQAPFKGTDLGELLHNVQQGEFQPPRDIRRDVPKPLEAICLKAMSLQPSGRYATARALADDIEHWLADEPTTAYHETTGERVARWSRTHRTAVTAGVALTATTILALVIGLIAIGAEQRETVKEREAAELARVEEAAQRKLAYEQKRLAEQSEIDADRERDAAVAASARSNYFLADARWKAGRVREAQKLLVAVPSEYRHIEWYLARREYEGSDMTLYGHSDVIHDVTFSPDGSGVASGSEDRTIKIWDARTGNELRTLTGHDGPVSSVTYSPDGSWIASGSRDRTVKIWEAQTGNELRTLAGHADKVTSVAFSPDGKLLASASDGFGENGDNTIKLWDASTGEELLTLDGHAQGIFSVMFSPDGSRIASGSWDKTIKVWDARTGEKLRTLAEHFDPVTSITFSPDGEKLASASIDETIKLWDVRFGVELHTLTGHTGWVTSVTFSPDGSRIASGCGDSTIKVWDARTGEELLTLTGHAGLINSVAFSPDGSRIASGCTDNTIKVWDSRIGAGLHAFVWHGHDVNSVVFSPDGSRIASGSRDQTVKVWDARTGSELRTLAGHAGPVSSVAFSPDGLRIASGSHDCAIKVWEAQSGKELRTLAGHADLVISLAFNFDGSRIASGSADNTIKVWDALTGEELRTLAAHAKGVASVAFSPDGSRIASGSWDKTMKLWDALTGEELLTRQTGHTLGVESVVFNPDGSRVASGGGDDTIKIWDSQTGEELCTLTGHAHGVTSLAFSPDGSRIASGSTDNTIKVWDGRVSEEFRAFTGHADKVISVAFSPDCLWIYSEDQFGNRLAWSVATGEKIATPDPWPDLKTLANRSVDGRWVVMSSGNQVLVIDLDFKNTPAERAYREFRSKLDPQWHEQQAKVGEPAELVEPLDLMQPYQKPVPHDSYSALFHRAWIAKAEPEDANARERLSTAYKKYCDEFNARIAIAPLQTDAEKAMTPVSTNPDDYLAPIVREILKK